MSEPTTALKKSDLDALAGWQLGFGRDSTDWTTEQQAIIDEMVKMAQRRVYVTEANPEYGIQAGYRWTFLKPVVTLKLESGKNMVDLPDDFGGLEGPITLADASSNAFHPIPQMGEPAVRSMQAEQPTRTGQPECVAVEMRPGTTYDAGQRARLLVFPTSDQAYTLKCQYYLTPDAMSGDRPYPYGGAQHAELFKAAVMACCDLEVHDKRENRESYFFSRLAASIQVDQRNREQFLGYVGDSSDSRHYRQRRRFDGSNPVLFNGTEYD